MLFLLLSCATPCGAGGPATEACPVSECAEVYLDEQAAIGCCIAAFGRGPAGGYRSQVAPFCREPDCSLDELLTEEALICVAEAAGMTPGPVCGVDFVVGGGPTVEVVSQVSDCDPTDASPVWRSDLVDIDAKTGAIVGTDFGNLENESAHCPSPADR